MTPSLATIINLTLRIISGDLVSRGELEPSEAAPRTICCRWATQHPLLGLVGAGLVRRTQCCKWPLKIDFKEFGWDWVLSPKTYSYCAGDCPGDSPYEVLMSGRGRCSPIRMYPMHMLYLDADRNVIKGRMPNMRVRECGCSSLFQKSPKKDVKSTHMNLF